MALYATGVRAEMMPEGENHMNTWVSQRPGAFYYVRRHGYEGDYGMIHSCPCGCGRLSGVYFEKSNGPTWVRTGPREAPTLSPSVGIRAYDDETRGPDGYHWHGWLRDGAWESV